MNQRADTQPHPIQPVENPILCNPYAEPTEHWVYDSATGVAERVPGRRKAFYWYKSQRVMTAQLRMGMLAEEESEELPLVNALREDVRRWRAGGYEGATQVTKELLAYWWRDDRARRLFFCQLEAAETIIFLNEIRLSDKYLRFKPAFRDEDLARLRDPSPLAGGIEGGLLRMGLKMATGSGKTVVMAMLIAWAFCNRGRVPGDTRFPQAALVVCPNLTIKERLHVLRPEAEDNYYQAFDLVPARLRPEIHKGKVLITNWHRFLPESEHVEAGESYTVVNKGPEGPRAFARRVLGGLPPSIPPQAGGQRGVHATGGQRGVHAAGGTGGGLLVFNDEGHHAWRPNPLLAENGGNVDQTELEEATVWVTGLDKLDAAVGIRACIDLSATPFYLHGSGYVEGSPFPWLVSDFGLVDAIESGLVKIPRLPVSDTTGRPDPKYFHLWHSITENLQPGDKLPGRAGKPKPEVVYREAEGALQTLAGQWVERFAYIQGSDPGKDKTPPVLIIVCDNTDLAEVFYRALSGEGEEEIEVETRRGKTKTVTQTTYGRGKIFGDYFSNTATFKPTVRIDSKLLAEAEASDVPGADPNISQQDAAEQLRQIVATVGQPGKPGEHVRCVVAVAMLNEGWDAHNVTHILGLRAFGSQLLCEQVVGRGLRRMDYTPDPATGKLTEEYVDIYGVPFSLIPFKGRATHAKAPEDKPKQHVRALPERAAFEIKFPVVEGYAFALRRNIITADVDAIEPLHIQPEHEPTAVFVKPRVGYEVGAPSLAGPGQFEEQDRRAFYESTHLQTIEFEIARQIVAVLGGERSPTPALRHQSRHQLFPQVLRIVHATIQRRVDFRGVDPRELAQERYVQRIVERLLAAIKPDDSQGEPPLLPLLNRYAPLGSTADVDFKTTRPCFTTTYSHINLVAADTARWEQSAAFRLEQAAHKSIVAYYARNDQLGLVIPYDYLGASHSYQPDFLVRLTNSVTLVLEIKGQETEQDRAKHQAARRWIAAVNHWGKLGPWAFHVCRDPQRLGEEIAGLITEAV